jgi:hypothetical protein
VLVASTQYKGKMRVLVASIQYKCKIRVLVAIIQYKGKIRVLVASIQYKGKIRVLVASNQYKDKINAGFVLEKTKSYIFQALIQNRAYLLLPSIQSNNILFPLASVLSVLLRCTDKI